MSLEADTVAVDIPVSSLNIAEMPLTLDSRPTAAVEASSSEPDTLLQLPSDFLKTPFTGYQAKWYTFTLSNTLLTDCQNTTQQANLQAFFLTAFNAVLHRYTQQEEIRMEVTLANGVSAKSYTTEIYTRRLGELQVRDLIAQTKAELENSIEQLKVSSLESIEFSSPKRRSNSPVAFTFIENTIDRTDQTQIEEDWHNRSQTTLEQLSEQPDLHLIIFQQPHHLFGIVQYNGNLFESATIQRLAGHLQVLTEGMVADLDRSIAQLPLLTAAEEQQLLGDWMSASVAYPQAPIHQLIETHALQQPNKTAVTFKTQQLTYAELNQKANQLAHYLNQSGVVSGSRVAVCLEPSLDVAVSLLGIFKAGAIYVPLDPTHPIDRLATILEDNQPQILITQSHLLPNLPSIEGQVFCCDQDWQTIQHLSIENPQNHISLDQTAYLVYTSGTTGKPKGVMASHGNLVNYILVAQDRYGFDRNDIMPAIARFTFSITMFELLSPLAAGGTLMLLEREHILDFKRMVQTLEQVTVIHTSPSLMRKLMAYIQEQGLDLQRFQGLRHVSTGGDLVPADLVETMKTVFQNAEVFVIYGCSEISCMGCTYPIPRDQTVSKSKVGKPFNNVSVRLYDAHQNLVPIGIVGEIYFGGNGITQGYLNRDELTQDKFVRIDGQRFYRTGDMGRFDAEGNLEILGRSDFQIKLRGIRIELGEIETTLRQAPGVRDGVVGLRELGDEPALIAYVVLHREETSLINNIRAFLQERLPDYMVPAGFVVLEALPVNLNQKVDRRALPAPTPENLAGFAEYVPPQDEWQQKLVQIWEEVLGIHPIGIRNSFLELGGNSLLAVQMLTQVEKVFERELPITMLLKCPTIEALAEAMQSVSDEASEG
ncbi:MAG TPA: amino acid adenylation domain-containing protein, partial [Allocoleopsis sp.]